MKVHVPFVLQKKGPAEHARGPALSQDYRYSPQVALWITDLTSPIRPATG